MCGVQRADDPGCVWTTIRDPLTDPYQGNAAAAAKGQDPLLARGRMVGQPTPCCPKVDRPWHLPRPCLKVAQGVFNGQKKGGHVRMSFANTAVWRCFSQKNSIHVRRRAAARGVSSPKNHAGCENMKRRFMFGRSFCPRRQGASAQKQHRHALRPVWSEPCCGSPTARRSSRTALLGCPEARPRAGSQTRRVRSHASSR